MSKKLNVLIVDDQEQMRVSMGMVVSRLGHKVTKAENGKRAKELIANNEFDLVISDIKMPELTGQELLDFCKKEHPSLPIVMITAYGTISDAVEAMKKGALDFITKPFSPEELEQVIARVANPPRLKKEAKNPDVTQEQKQQRAILTNDNAFKKVLEVAILAAKSSASVMVQGESGTGKELVSRLVHNASTRANQPFIAVNCAAIPAHLLESELFGYEKGSFTGAVNSKLGKFEMANGGTLFLDEITEMDLALQAKLLRAIQEKEIDRIGGVKPIRVDIRIVSATNKDPLEMVRQGKFREDLYYRLNVIPLHIPPLRERKSDIKLLSEHFIRNFSKGKISSIDEAILNHLLEHEWSGNVRELENSCHRAVVLSGEGSNLNIDAFMI